MNKLVITLILFAVIISVWADVKDCIPVVTTFNDQINQVVVTDGVGGAIIAWQDARSGDYNIYARRVLNGVMQWNTEGGNGLIVCNATGDQVNLSMVSDGAGGAIIAWQDARDFATTSYDIYAQRVDINGIMQWTANGITVCNATGNQLKPKLATDEASGAFVTWYDLRLASYNIYVLHIISNGSLIGIPNGTQIGDNTATINQTNPQICSDGALGAIITYEQYITGFNDQDIFAQRVDPTCTILWAGGGVPACIAAYDQRNPQIVNDAIGSAIIVWEDFVNSANWDIYAQRISAGSIQWVANGVAIRAVALDQINPTIVSSGPNSAIIAWQHYVSATDCNIYAKKISGATVPTFDWSQYDAFGAPVTTHVGKQMYPQAVTNGSNGAYIVWQDERVAGTDVYDIYAQQFNSTGSYAGEGVVDGYGICTWAADQLTPMLAYSADPINGVVYAWIELRNEPTYAKDIYTLGTDIPPTLPVELSSFNVSQTTENFAQLQWVTQSETGVVGFYVYRNDTLELNSATLVSPLIDATNTSQETTYSYVDSEVVPGTWYYWLQNTDMNGSNAFHGPISIILNNGDNPTPEIPSMTSLDNVYPNPFNPFTNISYKLAKSGNVNIGIYNMKGQLIRTLVSENKQADTYLLHWDGTNSKGQPMPSGVYYVKMVAGEYLSTQKAILLK